MSVIDDLKNMIKDVADKAPQATKDAWEKARIAGDESLGSSKEYLNEISDKVSDIAKLTKTRFDIYEDTRRLDDAYLALGKLVYQQLKNKTAADQEQNDLMEKHIQRIKDLKNRIAEKTAKYEQMKKDKAGQQYIISRFSEELAKSGHIMDQAYLSQTSNMNGKLMKEILLPKEALITSIKRGEELIIPDGNTQFLAGDRVTVMGAADDVQKIIKRLQG